MNEFPYRDDADKSNDLIKKFHKSITAVSNPIFLAKLSTPARNEVILGFILTRGHKGFLVGEQFDN